MEHLDTDYFNELLRLQAERALPEDLDNNGTQAPNDKLIDKVRLLRIKENKKHIESNLNKNDLPENYYFSALAELILNDDI